MKKSILMEKIWYSLCKKSKDTKLGNVANNVSEEKLFLIPKRSFPLVENEFLDNCGYMILVSSPHQNTILLDIWFSI